MHPILVDRPAMLERAFAFGDVPLLDRAAPRTINCPPECYRMGRIMPSEIGFFKSIAKEGFSTLVIEVVKWAFTWLSAPGAAFMTLLAGYLQSVPWVATIPFSALSFAALATGMLRYDEWRQRNNAEYKIHFHSAAAIFEYSRSDKGEIIAISKAQVLINFINTASFPIYYKVDEIATSVDGRVNPHPDRPLNGLFQQSGTMQYRDSPIEMNNAVAKPMIEAIAKIKLRYGLSGKEKYPIDIALKITCPFTQGLGYLPQNQVCLDIPKL
jgi:hypothetical protein